eukprot:g37469.t1
MSRLQSSLCFLQVVRRRGLGSQPRILAHIVPWQAGLSIASKYSSPLINLSHPLVASSDRTCGSVRLFMCNIIHMFKRKSGNVTGHE